MADSSQTEKTPEAELLLLEARLEKWCEQFERARPTMPSGYAKKAEKRLLAMRQRLNIMLVEKGLFGDPSYSALEQLDDKELELVAESLQQSVRQYQKLKNELLSQQELVKKQLIPKKAPHIRKAIDTLRAKLEAFHKHDSQFRPVEDLVSGAARQVADDGDIIKSFLGISSRLKDVTRLNKAIAEQESRKESMTNWLQKQRRRLTTMAFQKPPSEQSLDESSTLLPKVAVLNRSLQQLIRARRYLEGILAKNGMNDA